jgi:hypothetical protein
VAVKVTLVDTPWVENFEGDDDMFSERKDGKLEIHRGDGTTKVFQEHMWTTVDGKKKPVARAAFA